MLNPDFIADLRKIFRGDIRLDPAARVLYSTDASIYQIEPIGVAIPKTQEDLHAALELAAQYKIPILPRGAGTSLGGQAIGEALILDCSRHLDSIIDMDPETHSAIVEPGVILAALNRAAAKHGLMFGPDPASAERATMGGVIGNNATGAHSILYGMTADHLLSADVILSDGSQVTFDDSIFDTRKPNSESRISNIVLAVSQIREHYTDSIKQNYPRSWRNSAGYRLNYLLPWSPSSPPQWDVNDYGLTSTVYRRSSTINLASILAGSEGTLAVIRRAKVNLVPKPKHTILAILAYDSISTACDDVLRLLEFKPSAIELIPQMILRLARNVPAYARMTRWVVGDPAAMLAVEFSGPNPETLKSQARNIGEVLAIAETAEEQALVWGVRKVGLGILDSAPISARPLAFIEDCAIPVAHLGQFVREIERILVAHKTHGGIYAHASAGCLHIRPLLDLHTGEGVRAIRTIGEQVFALARQLGGSMSSEHGDGIVRGEFIEPTYGRKVTDAMRQLKHAADPHTLLNPGKLFDAPPMDTHLRFRAGDRAPAWITELHFDHARGRTGAIEQCNGQGVCRKETGVMCPSYQATRAEANSTRGRANLLRALIASPKAAQPPALMEAAYSALDLCLACKGCTSECPSGVDMPRLKYEFMHEYYRSRRRPLRDYLFGFFHVAARILSPGASLANRVTQMNATRRLIAAALGIADQRPLPAFAGRRARKRTDAPLRGRGRVLFLPDVFSRYVEPQVEQAALDLLHAAGYEVDALPVIGAGASLLSKGFIPAARRHAESVLEAIRVRDGGAAIPVVGCEPPEIACLKHEYAALLPRRRDEVTSIASRTWYVEEFLLRSAPRDSLRVARTTNEKDGNSENAKITFHPHCHQRAEPPAADGLPSGPEASAELLRRFGFEVEIMDAGCCGMAGTFGYEAEHYELSMQIGELGVLPKARAAELLAATGAACRMQIKQGAGKDAVHPLVLIRDKLYLK
ncbi:MAG: hypothetical protein HFACDABA_02823 [Anaerolineales bacterium]|nr:hypothetical protein [Anaerolineales bacterium]